MKYTIEVATNIKIADFMGCKKSLLYYHIPEHKRLKGEMFSHDVEWSEYFASDELEYHKSWDWLLPVVKKMNCEELNQKVLSFNITEVMDYIKEIIMNKELRLKYFTNYKELCKNEETKI